MKVKAKYHKEERNGKDFWTCELWSDGVYLAYGFGATQEQAKQNALKNYNQELEKYG